MHRYWLDFYTTKSNKLIAKGEPYTSPKLVRLSGRCTARDGRRCGRRRGADFISGEDRLATAGCRRGGSAIRCDGEIGIHFKILDMQERRIIGAMAFFKNRCSE